MFWRPSEGNHWWRPQGTDYFDTRGLRPADILLFAPFHPNRFQRGIQFLQKRHGFAPDHHRFTHAALYLGYDHLLCESLAERGVVYSSLENVLYPEETSVVRVRRFPGLTDEQCSRVLIAGTRCLGVPYSWEQAIFGAFGVDPLRYRRSQRQGLICSALCHRAFLTLTEDPGVDTRRLGFQVGRSNWVCPAALSATANLEDVAVHLTTVAVPASGPGRRGPGRAGSSIDHSRQSGA